MIKKIKQYLSNIIQFNKYSFFICFQFTSKIIKLLTRLDYKGTVAVFENGHCECLKEAIGNRKKTRDAVINDGETIELAKLCIFRTKAICIIVSVDNKVILIYSYIIIQIVCLFECGNFRI